MVKSERALILVLAIIQFTHIVDFMIIMPLGKSFMEHFSISPQQFSWLVSVYAFAAFIMGLVSALYVDRFDRRDALLFLYAGFSIGTFGCALAPSYGIFLAARALTGAFGGILTALVFSIIGDVIPFERRGKAMGQIMSAFAAASIIGVPAGIFLGTQANLSMPFWVIGGLSVFSWFFSYWKIPALRQHLQTEDGQPVVHTQPLEVLRMVARSVNQQWALLFTIVLIFGHFTIIPFIAPYMEANVGLNTKEVGLIYVIGGIVSAVFLQVFGRLGDRFGHIKVFTFSSLAAVLSIFFITNLPMVSLPLALLSAASFFLVASGRSVPATTMVTAVVKPQNRGSFMSIRQSVTEAGLAITSFIAGSIVVENPDGSLGQYEYAGYLAIVMSLVAILVARKLKTVA